MLVFLIFDLFIGRLQELFLRARQRVRRRADQFPIGMVFGLGDHHTLGSHRLSGSTLTGNERDFHGAHQRGTIESHNASAGSFLIGIQPQLFKNIRQDRYMIEGLSPILFPLSGEIFVHGAENGGFVDQHSAFFRFERFVQQGMYLVEVGMIWIVRHKTPSGKGDVRLNKARQGPRDKWWQPTGRTGLDPVEEEVHFHKEARGEDLNWPGRLTRSTQPCAKGG